MEDKYSLGTATTLQEYDDLITKCAHRTLWPLQFGLSGEKQKNLSTVYRGHASKEYILQPSIFRNSNDLQREDELIKIGEKCAKQLFGNCFTNFDIIAIMQHYGTPTRFLDFSIDPRQALYFACDKEKEKDGQVVLLQTNHVDSNCEEIRTVLAFTQLPFKVSNIGDKLRKQMNQMLPDSVLYGHLKKHYLVYPSISNDRLRIQKGAFVVFGQVPGNGTKVCSSLFDAGMGVEGYRACINIPADAKDSILIELEKEGITKDSVYPPDHGWYNLMKKSI